MRACVVPGRVMILVALHWAVRGIMLLLATGAHGASTSFSIGLTGDVNLNPLLKGSQLSPEYVWG